jgi:hypothetical protein
MQLAFISLMHKNKKRNFVYLSGAGAAGAVAGTVFGGFTARLSTIFFFGAFSTGARGRCTSGGAHGCCSRGACSDDTCSGDKVIPLPLPLHGCNDPRFFKFWGIFFAFVLLEMIGISQGFKTFESI